MNMARRNRMLLLVAAVGACTVGVIPGLAGVAHGQVFVAGGGGPMGGAGMMDPPVTRREMDRYSDMLGLGASQRDAAEAMFEGFEREFQQLAAEISKEMQSLRAEFEDTRDHTVFMEEMPRLMQRMRSESRRMESALLDDFRLLLSDDQLSRWGSVERLRRRDRSLGTGFLSGESVDLVRLVDDLKLPEPEYDRVAPVLEQYEVDLDRAIVERDRAREEQRAFMTQGGGGPRMMELNAQDPEFTRLRDRVREASVKLRDVNRRYARQLSAAMPEPFAQGLDQRFMAASFPEVFRGLYADRVIESAAGFADLSADQRASLEAVRAAYEREIASTNARLISAIEKDEATSGGSFMGFGGAVMHIRDDEGDGELASVRRARRELDRRVLEQVKGLLNEQQVQRLPERGAERESGGVRFGGGGGVGVMRSVQVFATEGGATEVTEDVVILEEPGR